MQPSSVTKPASAWWYGASPPTALLESCGLHLLGSGQKDPPAEVDAVIFNGETAAEIPLCLLRWRTAGCEPAVLVVGDQQQTCDFSFLPTPPEQQAWSSIIREVVERRQALQDSKRLRQDRDRLRSRLAAAESQLRDRQEELVRLETQASMSQLVRSLAHELNNPLAVILGNGELIQRSADQDERLARRSQTIIQEVANCQQITERLRRFARPQGERPKALRIPEVLAQAVQRLRRRGSPIPDFIQGDALPMVHCGRLALVRALEQVLDNALRAGGQTVTVSAEERGRQCLIHLSNDGSTPSDEDIKGACRPFFSSSGGSGLGLSLAASLLADYRGTVSLDRGPGGRGATTSITLPIWDQQQASREREGASSDDWLPVQSSSISNLLVIEDEKLVAELVTLCAEEMGWTVRVAKRLEQAHEALHSWDAHAILADSNIHGEDGIALLREVLERRSDLVGRVAIMSGDLETQAVEQMIRDWDCATIAKPFRLQGLRSMLEELRS